MSFSRDDVQLLTSSLKKFINKTTTTKMSTYLFTEIMLVLLFPVKALAHSSSEPLITNCSKFSFFSFSSSFFCFFCRSLAASSNSSCMLFAKGVKVTSFCGWSDFSISFSKIEFKYCSNLKLILSHKDFTCKTL